MSATSLLVKDCTVTECMKDLASKVGRCVRACVRACKFVCVFACVRDLPGREVGGGNSYFHGFWVVFWFFKS